MERIEEHEHTVPYGDRSGVAVEPWLTDQWFVDAETLAGPRDQPAAALLDGALAC